MVKDSGQKIHFSEVTKKITFSLICVLCRETLVSKEKQETKEEERLQFQQKYRSDFSLSSLVKKTEK